jgi:hypothetical protein
LAQPAYLVVAILGPILTVTGTSDLGLYSPLEGHRYGLTSKLGTRKQQFGFAGTTPIAGDWDGDGLDDFGCYHPPSGMWYRMMSKNSFDTKQFGFDATIPLGQ